MQTLRVCLVIIASSTAWAGWQKDCRHQLHAAFQSARADLKQCRLDHGTSTTTTTITMPSTTTTLAVMLISPSENCGAGVVHCIYPMPSLPGIGPYCNFSESIATCYPPGGPSFSDCVQPPPDVYEYVPVSICCHRLANTLYCPVGFVGGDCSVSCAPTCGPSSSPSGAFQ